MSGAAGTEGGLWRPANGTEGNEFEAKWCAHCINSTPDVWEDEFGNDVAGGCAVMGQAVWCHQPQEWIVRHGMPWCTAFVQDPDRPARCLFTKDLNV